MTTNTTPTLPASTDRPTSELVEREAKADHARACYARALESMRVMLLAVRDGLEDEGDRIYLGSTNHADLIEAAWDEADALKWDEILAHTQPETTLAATNLHLQSRITTLEAKIARLQAALEDIAVGRRRTPLHSDTSCLCQLCAEAPGNLRARARKALTLLSDAPDNQGKSLDSIEDELGVVPWPETPNEGDA